MQKRVLLVCEEEQERASWRLKLQGEAWTLQEAVSREEALKLLEETSFALLALWLAPRTGTFLQEVRRRWPAMEVVLLFAEEQAPQAGIFRRALELGCAGVLSDQDQAQACQVVVTRCLLRAPVSSVSSEANAEAKAEADAVDNSAGCEESERSVGDKGATQGSVLGQGAPPAPVQAMKPLLRPPAGGELFEGVDSAVRRQRLRLRMLTELQTYRSTASKRTKKDDFVVSLEQFCVFLRRCLGAQKVRLLLSVDGTEETFCAPGAEGWAREGVPERMVLRDGEICVWDEGELAEREERGEKALPEEAEQEEEPVGFLGLPFGEMAFGLTGAVGVYADVEARGRWEEGWLPVLARTVGGWIANRYAACTLERSYAQHIEVAQFNTELLQDFQLEEVNELKLYARVLDRLLAEEGDELRPPHALVIRTEPDGSARALPFHRRNGQQVSVMGPALRLWDWEMLFPTHAEGVLFNAAPLPSELPNLPAPTFPSELIEAIGKVQNFVCCPLHALKGSIGSLVLFNYGRPVRRTDAAILMSFSMLLGFQVSIVHALRHRQHTQMVAMGKLALLAEKRDGETGAHLRRMSQFSKVLAEQLAASHSPYHETINDAFIREITDASPLHDIGKVGIEDEILCKPDKLTEEEYEIMKTHTTIGAQVLEGPDFLEMAREIALCHHERFDGSGYPRGLVGEDIPLAARIVALADVYDALTSSRKYRVTPYSHEDARRMILDQYGKHFDPAVVEAFLHSESLFCALREQTHED